MREEPPTIAGRAARAGRYLCETETLGLLAQHGSEVQLPGARSIRGAAHGSHDLRPYFIAAPANPYSNVHYDVGRHHPNSLLQDLNPPRDNPGSGSAPPGVEQRRGPLARRHEIDWNAIGDGDQHQAARYSGGVPVGPFQERPSGLDGVVPLHTIAVDLV